jgi:hypothetical protein
MILDPVSWSSSVDQSLGAQRSWGDLVHYRLRTVINCCWMVTFEDVFVGW